MSKATVPVCQRSANCSIIQTLWQIKYVCMYVTLLQENNIVEKCSLAQ